MRVAWLVGALVYVAVGVWLVFGPAPGAEAEAVGTAVRRVESRLANQPRDVDADIALFGLRDEEFSNVLLFVPLPIVLVLRWPRWWWAGLPPERTAPPPSAPGQVPATGSSNQEMVSRAPPKHCICDGLA